MNPNARAIVALAQQEAGDRYVYGAEVNLSDPNPPGPFDCSELVQWSCAVAGVTPTVPDGSAAQLAHCRSHGTVMAIKEGIQTAGALLFIQTASEKHVVISRGDGTTIEARGRLYGVGNFPATGRPWTHAARIPGVDYSQHPAPQPVPKSEEDDDVRYLYWVTGAKGTFWVTDLIWTRKILGTTDLGYVKDRAVDLGEVHPDFHTSIKQPA